MHWTLAQIAAALGSTLPTGPAALAADAVCAGVSIDSRTVRAGELFFAIRGPRHDGHDYVAAALAAGAVAAVVAHARLGAFPAELRGRLLVVEDTLDALQHLAREVRRSWAQAGRGRRVAAITGSTGKTTTKEILAALVATRRRVLKSEGNLNNAYGLPLTLCRLEPDHEAVVVEVGMSRRGELARLAAIAEPEIGVVTNVGPVHLEFFSSVDEIALAKRELIEGLASGEPVAVLNADDSRVSRFAEVFRGRVVTFGFGPAAQYRARGVENRGAEGIAFTLVSPQGEARLALSLSGRHNLANALAALAAAAEFGVGAEEARPVLRALKPPAMRGELVRFADGFAVINDSYNSNPVALTAAAELLATTPGYRRRILAAGEMLELGPASAELHREAGRQLARLRGIDWIFGVQGNAAEIPRGAVEAGFSEARTQFFEDAEQAARFLVEFLGRGDLLLVKGSRGVHMERIVERLAGRYARAEEDSAPASNAKAPGTHP
ncbi:MAG: UDP-N-acetylmuramoyl-tripeptide--D-alanyl-D-alanine ligase [Acidobacteriia bacterium]|nr:UDP-N-acetylmuramoyl-tripeptide--D-alanyl-D-alanine ligase [Terriglobia bacterium]